MRKSYNSVYAIHIEQFVEMKHALGFKFVTQQIILAQLDDFAILHKEKSSIVTKQFADKWSKKGPTNQHYTGIPGSAYWHSSLNTCVVIK